MVILQATTEEKKAYLQQYLPKKRAAVRIEEDIQELRLDKMFPSQKISDMPRNIGNQQDLSDYMVKLEELEEELIKARYQKIVTYQQIYTDIEAMEDERFKELLIYRYLRGYGWIKICDKLHVEWAQVHRLHKAAVEAFEIHET